jgi:hypothetical protein
MTIHAPAAPNRNVAATPYRRTALVAGVFYLVTFAASIVAALLINPILTNPRYIVSAGSDPSVLAGCLLDIVNAIACIGTAVTLFPLVRRQNEGFALGFVTSRMLEAAIIMTGVISLLAVVTLRQDLAGTAGTNPATLITVGRSLVAVRNWTFLLGPSLMPAFNALLLGWLLYRSRLVPRVIPMLGLIGAPILLASTLLTFFGLTPQTSLVSVIATIPIFFWELFVGLWMTFKGFTPSPVTQDL